MRYPASILPLPRHSHHGRGRAKLQSSRHVSFWCNLCSRSWRYCSRATAEPTIVPVLYSGTASNEARTRKHMLHRHVQRGNNQTELYSPLLDISLSSYVRGWLALLSHAILVLALEQELQDLADSPRIKNPRFPKCSCLLPIKISLCEVCKLQHTM
jgi:hypothetical protein